MAASAPLSCWELVLSFVQADTIHILNGATWLFQVAGAGGSFPEAFTTVSLSQQIRDVSELCFKCVLLVTPTAYAKVDHRKLATSFAIRSPDSEPMSVLHWPSGLRAIRSAQDVFPKLGLGRPEVVPSAGLGAITFLGNLQTWLIMRPRRLKS